MPSYTLELERDSGELTRVPIDSIPFWVGRDPKSDLCLDDPVVSRRHAFVERYGDHLWIVDNGSRNGVRVNHRSVEDRAQLFPGDIITIGPYAIALSLTARPTASTLSATVVDFYPPSTHADAAVDLGSGLHETKRDTGLPWVRVFRLLLEGPTKRLRERILDVVEEVVDFDRCYLILRKGESLDALDIDASRGAPSGGASTSEVFVSQNVLERVVSSGEAVALEIGEPAFDASRSLLLSGARSVLCVPLVADGNVLGVIYLDRSGKARPFSKAAVDRLLPLAGAAALKIQNARLLDARVESRVSERELEIARTVQERFLPRERIQLEGYSLDAFSEPCREVGGDCLDFFEEPRGRLTFAIGDVSGKGLPAALYMVSALSAMRAHLSDGLALDEVMGRLDRHVKARFRPDHFLTLIVADLDIATGTLAYCNAGHPAPIVVSREGDVRRLDHHGPALNIAPEIRFRRCEHPLAAGDLVVLFTDGVIEERDEQGEEFGEERLLSLVVEHRAQDVKTIRKNVLSAIDAFSESDHHQDDLTLLLLRRDVDG